jgi:ribosomal protein S18 acetylase RimI-like enzyme
VGTQAGRASGSRDDAVVDVVVRRIRADEGPTLRDVRLRALGADPAAFGSTWEREVALTDVEWADRAQRTADGDERATFVAEVDGRVVGLVGGYRGEPGASTVHLISMWTDPTARGRGVGRALLDAVVTHARDSGADQVDLWVVRTNAPALRLYEAAGFVPGEGEPPPTLDACRDELWLVLPL